MMIDQIGEAMHRWFVRFNGPQPITLAFKWAVVILGLIAISCILAAQFGLTSNLIVMWAIFLVLTVLVHEFSHAFQSKIRGHNIKEPAVLWLKVSVKNSVGVVLIGLALQNLIAGLVYCGQTVVMLATHFQAGVAIVRVGIAAVGGQWFTLHPPIILMLLGAFLIWKWNTDIKVLNWAIKLPLGVGMHTTHEYRDISDIVAGVTGESAVWLLLGIFLYPVFLFMVPMTVLINIVIPFKLRGEGNDAVCLWREQFARMRGFTGTTEI